MLVRQPLCPKKVRQRGKPTVVAFESSSPIWIGSSKVSVLASFLSEPSRSGSIESGSGDMPPQSVNSAKLQGWAATSH
jgi:hypothetical protein